jgi:hypothetical protein
MTRQVTVRELIEILLTVEDQYALVTLEGCDCIGECSDEIEESTGEVCLLRTDT